MIAKSSERARPARGFTLVELMIVIITSAFLLTTLLGIVHTLMRLENAGGDRLAEAGSLSKLAASLRRDAHAAATAESPSPDRLVLARPGRPSIEYRVEPTGITRKILDPTAKATSFESYRVASGHSARMDVSWDAGRPLVVLSIHRGDVASPDFPEKATRVEAAVGLDRIAAGEVGR